MYKVYDGKRVKVYDVAYTKYIKCTMEKGNQVYDGAYTKFTECTMEKSVQRVQSVYKGYQLYDEAYTKCTKCTIEHTLSVQSVRLKKCTYWSWITSRAGVTLELDYTHAH